MQAATLRELSNSLSQTSAFRALSQEARDRIASRMEIKELLAGEILVREGESGDTLYVVLEGLIEISRSKNARHSKRTYTVGSNAVIGELAVFTGNPGQHRS